jgi:hypothetical protein
MGLLLASALGSGPAFSGTTGCPPDAQGTHRLPLDPVEAGLMIRSTSFHREGISGFRVWADGRFERRRENGPWVVQRTLSALQVASIEALIVQSDLATAAGVYGRPEQHSDVSAYVMEFPSLGEGGVQIARVEGCKVPALQIFLGALNLLLVDETGTAEATP